MGVSVFYIPFIDKVIWGGNKINRTSLVLLLLWMLIVLLMVNFTGMMGRN